MDDERTFTARDAKELAGLSYRQLNDWESRGAAQNDRAGGAGWRKFTPKQLFALMVCNEIRKQFSIPVEKLNFVNSFMLRPGRNHIAAAARLMGYGLHVFLLTDLEKTFVLDSDLEFTAMFEAGYFRSENGLPFLLVRLNEVVNRLLGALKDPVHLQTTDTLYDTVAKSNAARTISSEAEFELLAAIRSGKYDRIEIRTRDGEIQFVNAAGDVANGDLSITPDSVRLARASGFETVSVTSRDGAVVDARRERPTKYSEEANDPLLFGPIIRAEREQLKQARDGKKSSGGFKTKTSTRSDGKSPSNEDNRAPVARSGPSNAHSRRVPPNRR